MADLKTSLSVFSKRDWVGAGLVLGTLIGVYVGLYRDWVVPVVALTSAAAWGTLYYVALTRLRPKRRRRVVRRPKT